MEISTGKLRGLVRLADDAGRFKMMAIDQRGSLQQSLGRVLNKDPLAVGYEEIARVKGAITRVLAPHATAVLMDPIFGYPESVHDVPRAVGVLLAYEETGYDKAGPTGRERLTRLIEGWSVEKASGAGADAVKLLLYYHPDASEETRASQQELVSAVGAECCEFDIPFVLELVAYPLAEGGTDTPEFARHKADLVQRSAAEFSKPEYGVDILKLEFPADLRYAREYCSGAFDGKDRPAQYSVDQVLAVCQTLDDVCGLPWVILSAGVGIREFLAQLELAVEAGASGFLCGRAIWKDAVTYYPDEGAMERHLAEDGAYNFLRANAAAERALPWFAHRRFGGWANIAVAGRSPLWYREYGEPPALLTVEEETITATSPR
ncbi:MAG: tagatose 1,6-diphosphate aldolase [Armatimonadetes bacterium]|nr:tagatose 1,6-diphosphate aldolase [Armatimonadota bacterium]